MQSKDISTTTKEKLRNYSLTHSLTHSHAHAQCLQRPQTSQQIQRTVRPLGSLQPTTSQRTLSWAGDWPTSSKYCSTYFRLATAWQCCTVSSGIPFSSAVAFCEGYCATTQQTILYAVVGLLHRIQNFAGTHHVRSETIWRSCAASAVFLK